jgi:hypothetical protein
LRVRAKIFLPVLLNPAFQADEEGGISSASCAALACGYEDKALQANCTDANHFQFSINRSHSGFFCDHNYTIKIDGKLQLTLLSRTRERTVVQKNRRMAGTHYNCAIGSCCEVGHIDFTAITSGHEFTSNFVSSRLLINENATFLECTL